MIEKLKIRLSDWRDRDFIQPLRKKLGRPVDGGLYELLNWPTHHAHIAMLDGRPVGFTSVILNMSGDADDIGTSVHEEFRRQKVSSELRYAQVRDLAVMGFGRLFCAVPQANVDAVETCRSQFGEPIGEIISPYLAPHYYFGAALTAIEDNLLRIGTRRPFPLSDVNRQKLMVKIQRAQVEAMNIKSLGDFNYRKAILREK